MKKLLVALLVLGLAAPAMAAEVGLYGSFRTQVGYYDADEDFGYGTTASALNGPAMDPTIFPRLPAAGASGFDDQGTLLSLSHQSRFGAKAKVSDTLNAVLELGLRETNRSSTVATASAVNQSAQQEAVYLRLAYGTWNFGAGALTVGKDYTPGTFLLYNNMIGDIGDGGDAVFLITGLPYIGRQPQIKFTFGGLQFAFIEANTGSFTGQTPIPTGSTATDVDFLLPRMEVAYQFNSPMFSLRPVAGYQTYDVVTRTATEETDKSIDSYLLALGAQLRLGAFYANATGSYMINAGNYGQSNLVLVSHTAANALITAGLIGDDIEDSTLTMATLALGFKISPMLKVEVGASYNNVERDLSTTLSASQTGYMYYGQMPITLAPGVTVIPEIGMMDRGDLEIDGAGVSEDEGTMTYFAANFRIDF
ncbi:MAG: hypothetical protein HZB24_08910 [Desulfobacterales bacterium]|nr:hypothetical protein [Desulfobacterales bacterium]